MVFYKLCTKRLPSEEAWSLLKQQAYPITRNNAHCLLQVCEKGKDAELARQLQILMGCRGLDSISVLGDHLIRIFAEHGNLVEANQAFQVVTKPTVYSWAASISTSVKLGRSANSIQLFYRWQLCSNEGSSYIYVAVLKACTITKALMQGRIIHLQVMKYELQSDAVLGSTMLDMYAKCGSLGEAHRVFEKLPVRDVVSWGAMIAGYAQNGDGIRALDCIDRMQLEGIKANEVILVIALKACGSIGKLEHGRLIHEQIVECGIKSGIAGNILVDMYAKCDSLVDAEQAFDRLSRRNIVSWNAMIGAYVQHGKSVFAFRSLEKMQEEGRQPNEVTLVNILKASANLGAIEHGRLAHDTIIQSGLQEDCKVGNTLADMYAKCGSLEEAHKVFENLPNQNMVSWGVMIGGLAQQGENHLALEYFEKMQEENHKPNEVIFLSILKVCASMGAIYIGRLIHNKIVELGLTEDIVVGSALVDMYAKCDSVWETQDMFNKLSDPDVIAWCALIGGYAQLGHGLLALGYFELMQEKKIEPNHVTFLSLLKACASIGSIGMGRLVHNMIMNRGLHLDVALGSAVIDMYANCGTMAEAFTMLDKLSSRNVVSWNAVVAGYAQHGDCFLAFECFRKMQQEGINPDEVSFNGILIACSRVGLVDEGYWHFKSMKEYHQIIPCVLHIACMIDLLSRAGCLNDAECMLQTTNQTHIRAWMSLLSACKTHGNIGLAKHCFDHVAHIDINYTAGYVLMSNIFANPS